MSRVAWVDATLGVAGDMLLGALLDAGADARVVREGLAALDLPGWELEVDEVLRGGLRATRARFVLDGPPSDAPRPSTAPPRALADAHPPHRPYSAVAALLARAPLPERARARATATYRRLAEAEARLHGVPVAGVELHEVGSTDAILDVVGVCLALEDLGVDRVVGSALPAATGRVRAAHGDLPLPAPATLALLAGWPLRPEPAEGEWVTPTGAALLSTLAEPGHFPAMVLERVGHGAGHRDPPDRPNLVRVALGQAGAARDEAVVELACNLDDFTGELVPPLVDRLLVEGALDAWCAPVVMKKGRPGLVVHALARPADAERLSAVLLRHSSSLGVRRAVHRRACLDRWHATVETPWGAVRVKVGGLDGEPWHAAPEHEDVAALAAAADVPVHEVHAAALAAWWSAE